jgi:hypothetical protein
LVSLAKTGVDGKVTTSLPTAIQGTYAPAIKPSVFGLTSSTVTFSYGQVAGATKYRVFLTNVSTGRLIRAVESSKVRVSLANLTPNTDYKIQVVAYGANGAQLSKKNSQGITITTKAKPAPAAKVTIRCVGAAKSLKVTGVTPKCPTGYRLDETAIKLGEIRASSRP